MVHRFHAGDEPELHDCYIGTKGFYLINVQNKTNSVKLLATVKVIQEMKKYPEGKEAPDRKSVV